MSFDPYRAYTQARIGLGHDAPALPTKAWLQFAYHHACAIDAVHTPWAINDHSDAIKKLGFTTQIIDSQIANRSEFLMRPDLGRKLSATSVARLQDLGCHEEKIVIAISNGLSSTALHHHLAPFLKVLLADSHNQKYDVLPTILLVDNGRVGLIDHIGEILKPKLGIIIIGERPGLSSPDSLALYLTYRPRLGKSDAARNCISNIRPPHGLAYEIASRKSAYLINSALTRKLSGVQLKEENVDDMLLSPPITTRKA